MALNTNVNVSFVAKDAGSNLTIFQSNATTVSRTDVNAYIAGTAILLNTNATTETVTVDLGNCTLSQVTMIYVETNNWCKVSLLDNTAAANELTTLHVTGATANSAGKAYIETNGFTLADGDTFVLSSNTGAAGVNSRVSYFLGGAAKY